MHRAHRLPTRLAVPATSADASLSIERSSRLHARTAARDVSALVITRLSVDALVAVVVVIGLIGQVLIGLIGPSPGGS